MYPFGRLYAPHIVNRKGKQVKLSTVYLHVTYEGKLSGTVSFRKGFNAVTHDLTPEDIEKLEAVFASMQPKILDEAAAQLIQARDDLMAIEHMPSTGVGAVTLS